MAEQQASESWWIKVGVLYDKSGFRGVIGGLFDINKAAKNLYDSFRQVVDVNSDLYNSARYLNVSSTDLQMWERAFRLIGGSASDARGAISSLNFVYDKLRLGMDSGAAEIGARLGLSPEDYLSFDRMLKALNRSYNDLFQGDYGGFKTLAEQLGLSESAMLLVTQSTKDFNKTLRESSSISFIPEHQLKAARELSRSFEKLSIHWDVFKSKVISTSLPALSKVFERLTEVLNDPETLKRTENFFNLLEKKFSELATDENINTLIDNLSTVFEGIGYAIKGAGYAWKGTKWIAEGAGDLAGTVVGKLTSDYQKPTYKFDITKGPMNLTGLPADMAQQRNPIQLQQNITINGAQSPKAVAQDVLDVTQSGLNGNYNMRTVQNMRQNSDL